MNDQDRIKPHPRGAEIWGYTADLAGLDTAASCALGERIGASCASAGSKTPGGINGGVEVLAAFISGLDAGYDRVWRASH